ncbi:hypothetical protein RF55_6811 [Lasius niger]|uniref:Uncharacterized protein n=1 Tax=Lasius niger TaxID=67767 RepID=A0A0J7KSB1_LASNI|nr:hypothetical protein RF55_6811 [Lasius niger]
MSLEKTASYLLEVHVPYNQISEDTPQQSALRENALTAPDTADAALFMEAEVTKVVKTFKNNNKAPGPCDPVEDRGQETSFLEAEAVLETESNRTKDEARVQTTEQPKVESTGHET